MSDVLDRKNVTFIQACVNGALDVNMMIILDINACKALDTGNQPH